MQRTTSSSHDFEVFYEESWASLIAKQDWSSCQPCYEFLHCCLSTATIQIHLSWLTFSWHLCFIEWLFHTIRFHHEFSILLFANWTLVLRFEFVQSRLDKIPRCLIILHLSLRYHLYSEAALKAYQSLMNFWHFLRAALSFLISPKSTSSFVLGHHMIYPLTQMR